MCAEVAGAARPRHLLRSRHLVPGEVVLRETRATRWALLPVPTLLVAVLAFVTYAAAAAVWSGLPPFPALTGAFAALRGFFSAHVFVFDLLALLLGLSLLWLLVRYVRWGSTVYGVTDHRVVVQSGFFSRGFDEIPIPQIRGVDVYQSFGARLLRYGTVRISSEAGRSVGNEEWHGIPRPFEFQRTLETEMEGPSSPHLAELLQRAMGPARVVPSAPTPPH